MLYKPKFCCQCGEAIERENWNILKSRRFCDFCATEFVAADWMPKIGLLVGLLFGIFTFGSLFLSSKDVVSTKDNPNIKQLKQNNVVQKNETKNESNSNNSLEPRNLIATSEVQTQTNKQITALNTESGSDNKAEKLRSQPNKKNEPVYFCGAETKKGTPCTRRVKGGGRCWQHEGKAAMLSENQLSASQ